MVTAFNVETFEDCLSSDLYDVLKASINSLNKSLTLSLCSRYDDTNPEAEKKEYIDHIEEIVRWMGWEPLKVF